MKRGRLQWKTFDTIGPWVLCAASWRCSTLYIVGNISSKHRSGSIAPKLKLLPISRNATPRVQVTQPSSAQLPARMTRDGRRLLKNRDRALDEGAAPWARVAARCSNVPSLHLASIHLAIHLAIKSYPVAVELPPFPTRLKSTIFSPLVGLECSNTGYDGAKPNPSVGVRPLPL